MTTSEFIKLQRQINRVLAQAEDEAVSHGINIISPQFQNLLKELKEKLLKERGIDLIDYELAELEYEKEKPSPFKDIEMIKGKVGDIGPIGEIGPVGETGPEGEKGDKGDKGDQGEIGPLGLKGDVGESGPQGKTGPQGPQGKQGPKGEDGKIKGGIDQKEFEKFKERLTYVEGFKSVIAQAGTSNVKAFTDLSDVPNSYTGEGGNVVTVKVTEDGLEFGAAGSQGPTGPQGPQGFQGPQGIIGTQGTQGFQGTVGSQGPQGYQGVQGGLGSGAQGTQGFQGPQGPQGVQGFQGSQGFQGTQGPQGKQGYQGVVGPQGTQGFQGVQGGIGAQGTQGYQGTVGSQGPQGYQGVQGGLGAGTQGPQGFQGPQGIIGTQGTQGYQGPQGVLGSAPAGQIFLSSAGGWPQTSSACGVNTLYQLAAGQPNVYVMNFADTVNTYANWDLQMPSDWNIGTVTAYPYWTSTAFGVAIGVIWSFCGRSYANNDALGQAWPAYVSAVASGGTSNNLYIGGALVAGISGAGTNEFCCFQVGRYGGNSSDSLTAAASLLGVRIDYRRT